MTTASCQDIAAVQEMVARRIAEEEATLIQGTAGTAPDFAFNVLSGGDILNLQRAGWRVKDVLPEAGVAVIYGPSRAGKSFLVLDLSLAITWGADWFSWKTTLCPVLYVNLESSWGLQGRLKAWMQETGKELPTGLSFIIEHLDMRSPVHINALSRAAPKGGMVVIDTLNRAAPGADENSSRDMGLIIKAAADIQQAMGGLVLLVSHSGKDSAKGVRGHSSLFAALDACIEVDCRNNESRYLKLAKVKEGVDGVCHDFRLKPVVIGRDSDGNEITSCVVAPEEAQRREGKPLTPALQYALDSLDGACEVQGKEGVHLETWRAAFYAGHTGENTEAKKKAFQRARDGLVKLGKVYVNNDTYIRNIPGQGRDMSSSVPVHTNRDGTGHTPLGVSRLSRCPGDRGVSL